MSIRINIESEKSVTVLHVAGQLDRASVAQFTEVIESIEGEIALDLSELVFADDVGIDAIRSSAPAKRHHAETTGQHRTHGR